MWFWWRGTCHQACILVEGDCYSRGPDIFISGFSAFLSVGRCRKLGSWDSLLKRLKNYLGTNSTSFPRAQNASSWSSPWISFRVYCRSTTAVANDLVLVELAGGHHSLFYSPIPFTQFQPRFGWHFVTNYPTVLGILILRPDQDCLVKTLHVPFLSQAQLTVADSLWTTVLLVCYDMIQEMVAACCLFPYLELHYYNHWSYRTVHLVTCFKFPSHHHFYGSLSHTFGNTRKKRAL